MKTVFKTFNFIFMCISAQLFFTVNSWAGCGPPQCPITGHRIERFQISIEQCMSLGLYIGDIARSSFVYTNGDQLVYFHSTNPEVIQAKSYYTKKTGICEYDYTILEE